MDFRLPGMDGVETTLALVNEYPEVAVVCLTASASPRELDALLAAGAIDCLRKDEELDVIVGAIRRAGEAKVARVNLTSENTAIVLDSTADFPDAQIRFPNMRVVPLYVRFGEESFRDYVELDPHDFYDEAEDGFGAADDLAADAAGLPHRLPRARRLRADLLAAHLREALGHVPERVPRRRGRGRADPARRHRVRVGRDRDALARDPGAARARARRTRKSRR